MPFQCFFFFKYGLNVSLILGLISDFSLKHFLLDRAF